jgi:hypothetical protein
LCYNSKVIQREVRHRSTLLGQAIQAWVQKSGSQAKEAKARALMRKLDENLKARNFEEAEKTADSILMMIGASE